jgi:hypothetical protein
MTSSDPFGPFEVEITFCQPSPEVLNLLTGGAFDTNTPSLPVSIEIVAPIKRTFWQWLLRKPQQYRTYYIPRARIEKP